MTGDRGTAAGGAGRIRRRGALLLAGAALAAAGCADADTDVGVPTCEPGQRLGIVAQSVPDAAYVPCVAVLPPGWSFESFSVDDDGTRFSLRSDRSDRAVDVELVERCDVGSATPITPRDEGVRTYQLAISVSPRYAGRLYDVFARGCVVYEFDFARGPHIALIDELQQAVQLYPRRQLRQELDDELGITLDP
ncbi:MAG TPA: hypothetical protein VF015_02805 [Acidimicrobiales bacterium]